MIDESTLPEHHVAWPPILSVGTPVVLISTTNPDGTANLAPMSSAWWLGWRAVLGLADSSRTTENLRRTGEAVLTLPRADLSDAVVGPPRVAECPVQMEVVLADDRLRPSTLATVPERLHRTADLDRAQAQPRAASAAVQ